MADGIEITRRSPGLRTLRMLCVLIFAVAMVQATGAASPKETNVKEANSREAATKASKSKRSDHGAIAFHRVSGNFGYAVNRRNSREAKVEALKQCGNADCEVVLTLANSCGALATRAKSHFVARGATREEAEAKARRQCGQQCEIRVWACTK